MKKIILVLSVVLLALASCTQFEKESPLSPVVVDNPAIEFSEVQDSSFTVTFTPASGTGFYSYAILPGEAKDVDATTLFKVKLSNTVTAATVDYKKAATTKIEVKELDPYTFYTAYIISASEQGNLGDVIAKTIKTSDKVIPTLDIKNAAYADEVFSFSYDEDVKYVEGMPMSVRYYATATSDVYEDKECGTAKVEKVTIDGGAVKVAVDSIPAGADVTLSFAKGTFTDISGNDCDEVKSFFSTKQDDKGKDVLVANGICGRQKTEKFDLAIYGDEEGEGVSVVVNIADPIFIAVPQTTEVVKYNQSLEGSVTYEGSGYSYSWKTGNQHGNYAGVATVDYGWNSGYGCALCYPNMAAISGRPDPTRGDIVTVVLPEGFLTDKYGNVNNEFTIGPFLYSYGYKLEDLLGTYTYDAKSYFGAAYNTTGATLVIEKSDYEPEEDEEDPEYDFKISGGTITDVPIQDGIYGWFDGDRATMTIPSGEFGFAMLPDIDWSGEAPVPTGNLDIYTVLEANGGETLDFVFSKGETTTFSLVSGQFFGVYFYVYTQAFDYVGEDFYDVCTTFSATKKDSGSEGGVPIVHFAPQDKLKLPVGFNMPKAKLDLGRASRR